MQPNNRNLAVFLVLANYFLAVTVGAWFHDHAGHAHHQSGSCREHRLDQAHSHHEQDHSDKKSLPLSGKKGSCPVCRFMAQKPISVASAEEVTSAPLVEVIEWTEPIRRTSPVAFTYHSRAPPAVA